MKKPKKHVFKYSDPEKEAAQIKTGAETSKTKTGKISPTIKADLQKTVITTLGFIIIIFAFYLIQQKTGALAPFLKLFGL